MHHHNRGGKNMLKQHKLGGDKSVPRHSPHRVKQLPKKGNRGRNRKMSSRG
jgi:hypothetical protein